MEFDSPNRASRATAIAIAIAVGALGATVLLLAQPSTIAATSVAERPAMGRP